ncbi:MAG: hypothetical protein HFJ93_00170 [Muribaculaceae bacterium]|jgi:hypothetical protein|nr:hypothetical protein [Muribaculaceae bacterium]
MNKLSRHLISLCIALVMAGAASAYPPAELPKGWESAEMPARADTPEPGEIDIITLRGYVYVASRAKTRVSILTVLGQPLTAVTLPEGCHRFRIATRGIYILRTDSSTFRITI